MIISFLFLVSDFPIQYEELDQDLLMVFAANIYFFLSDGVVRSTAIWFYIQKFHSP